MPFPTQLSLHLPDWLPEWLETRSGATASVEERMRLTIDLSRENVERGTGGPFGAAVFECGSGRLVSGAVNTVLASRTSIAHAETLALALAQQEVGSHTLSAEGLPSMELVASSQPCVQCFGNTWWSGVKGLLIGARASDVEKLTGFFEGPLPDDWVQLLENRPAPLPAITVTQDLLRDEATEVLRLYRDSGAPVYNA